MTSVVLNAVYNGTKEQIEIIRQACKLIEQVINSGEFFDEVKNYEHYDYECSGYLWWKTCQTVVVKGFTTTDLTTQEVFAKIMLGGTDDDKTEDRILNIRIAILPGQDGRVVGYTVPGADRSYTYSWVLRDWLISDIAGHIFHEYLHRCGFQHASAQDYSSVPYAIGEIVAKLASQIEVTVTA